MFNPDVFLSRLIAHDYDVLAVRALLYLVIMQVFRRNALKLGGQAPFRKPNTGPYGASGVGLPSFQRNSTHTQAPFSGREKSPQSGLPPAVKQGHAHGISSAGCCPHAASTLAFILPSFSGSALSITIPLCFPAVQAPLLIHLLFQIYGYCVLLVACGQGIATDPLPYSCWLCSCCRTFADVFLVASISQVYPLSSIMCRTLTIFQSWKISFLYCQS